MGLLIASAVALFAFMLVVARQQLAVQKAVLTAKQLGQYTLEGKIGSGGMGSVYRARHALLRRPTAVKLLEPDKVSDLAVARFEREVQLTSRLAHPNTVAIYDYGRTPEGVFYYAMEYLDGIDLEDLVRRFGPVPEGRAVSILRQVCGSLAEAHGLGLVHRDVKPANVILCHRGGIPDFVKVLDFGLARAVGAEGEARLTAAGSLTGTPLYLAPEAVERPDAVDARADLYALGAVGYFLLTGTPVFRGQTIAELCMQHLKAPPEPPSQRLGRPLDPPLEALILKCLAKSPDDRPPSARAALDELAGYEGAGGWSGADAEAWWTRFKAEAGDALSGPVPETGLAGQTVAFTGGVEK
jgi:serine/threonine protein kinase